MEELVEKVKVLILNVDAGLKRLDVKAKEERLQTLRKQQETLALASDFKALEVAAREVKKIEQSLVPWQKLYTDSHDLESLLTLVAEEKEIQTELTTDIETLEKTYAKLYLRSLFSDARDTHNAYLSIHAGAGGTEACDWAEMLERTYVRFCERKKFQVSLVDLLRDTEAGIKSATLHVKGLYVYGYLKAEVGVHRLVRISPFDSGKRRHTSFASVSVVPELDETLDIKIDPSEVRIDTFRASGAGGQHVNTTDSAVRLTHLSSGIVVSCQVERSQYQNKEQAFKILKARLYDKRREEQLLATKESQKLQKKIEWGSQIRSYILHPYQLVKDHRTGHEVGDVKRVMDGNLDDFIEAFLKTTVVS